MKFVADLKRSHTCGQLNKSHVGQEVILMGWVESRRDHGNLVFVDLRDRYGVTQIVLNPNDASCVSSKDFRNEFVVAIRGTVQARPEGMQNKTLGTGEIEVSANLCDILSKAATTPFQINDDNVSENLRLKYRYLDLRSRKMQSNLRIRHELIRTLRNTLSDEGFLEVETPILYKSTPEGARDYLVPSRVHPGSFYALPQSPQTLKQLLMVAGYDRYFQVARCFRDEDLRAERQPEFTQLDIEMSFVDVNDVMQINEKLVKQVWKKLKNVDLAEFPKMTYMDAMNRYGCDKPDIRFAMELKDIASLVKNSGFKIFDDVAARAGGAVKAIAFTGGAKFSRAQIDKLTDISKQAGAKGLVWIKWEAENTFNSSVSKFFDAAKLQSICQAVGAKVGDAVFVVADDWHITCASLSALRLHLAHENKIIDTTKDAFLWVTDFPLLEYDHEAKRWMAMHHPFTAPKGECEDIMVNNQEERFPELLARAYDLVCNGYEIAGGSIRIHRSDVQEAMFRALRISPEEAQERFGFFIDALKYGTPPHGGIAWGLDRVSMILCGTEAIREVIAFPKTAKATCMMSESPSRVSRDQLQELHIALRETPKV